MAQCSQSTMCDFYNNDHNDKQAVGVMLKMKYCNGNQAHCARHIVSSQLGVTAVPATLWPSETDAAERIIQFGQY